MRLVILLAAALAAFPVHAEIEEIGPDDFRIYPNEFTDSVYFSSHAQPALALRSGHHEVAQVWTAYSGDATRLYLQRFSTQSMTPIALPVEIASTHDWDCIYTPSIVYNATMDEFVIAFAAAPAGARDANGRINHLAPHVQRIDAATGNRIGDAIDLLAFVSPAAHYSTGPVQLAWDAATNRYIAIWLGRRDGYEYARHEGAYLSASGELLGPIFTLNDTYDMATGDFSVTAVNDVFVVAWMDNSPYLPERPDTLHVQVFDPHWLGAGESQTLHAVSRNKGFMTDPVVAASPDGERLSVTWSEYESAAMDWNINAMMLDHGLRILGNMGLGVPGVSGDGLIRVARYPTATWLENEVVLFFWPDTVWLSSSGQDYERHMFVQRFDRDGYAIDLEPRAVTSGYDNEGRRITSLSYPSIVSDNGRILGTWKAGSYSGFLQGQWLQVDHLVPPDAPATIDLSVSARQRGISPIVTLELTNNGTETAHNIAFDLSHVGADGSAGTVRVLNCGARRVRTSSGCLLERLAPGETMRVTVMADRQLWRSGGTLTATALADEDDANFDDNTSVLELRSPRRGGPRDKGRPITMLPVKHLPYYKQGHGLH